MYVILLFENVEMGQLFLPVLRFFRDIYVAPMLHSN